MTTPTKASSSTEGVLRLSGDFTGNGENPQLQSSGVAAGTYPMTKRISVDKKGRVLSIGASTTDDINALIDAGYAADPSKFNIVNGRPSLILPTAVALGVAGLVKLGANAGTNGTVYPGPASTSSLGLVQIGAGFQMATTADPNPMVSAPITLDSGFGLASLWRASLPGNGSSQSSFIKNNGRYILVGTGSKAFYSTDGVNFTLVAAPIASAYGVVANGPNLLLALDNSSATSTSAMRSTDNGTTWVSTTVPAGTWNALASNGTLFVLAGWNGSNNAAISTSPDGVTWTSRTITGASTFIRGLIWTGSFFAASAHLSGTMLVYTSPDGITWTARTPVARTGSYPLVGYIDGKLIFNVGGQDGWRTSTDQGVTWTAPVTSGPYNYYGVQGSGTDFMHSIRYGSGVEMLITSTSDGKSFFTKSLDAGSNHTGSSPQYLYDGTNLRMISTVSSGVFESSVVSKAAATDPHILKKPGLNFDTGDLIPASGGTITGAFTPIASSATKEQIAISQTGTLQGTVTRENTNQLNVNLQTVSYPLNSTGNVGAATASPTMLLQVYLDSTGSWFSASSTDTATTGNWTTTKIATPPGAAPSILGLAYGGGQFVAIGRQSTATPNAHWVGTSPDGVTWTYNSTPFATGLLLAAGLHYGFGRFFTSGAQVSNNNFVGINSSNGTSWTVNTVGVASGAPSMTAFSENDGAPFALAVTNSFAFSTVNGQTWIQNTNVGSQISAFTGGNIAATKNYIWFTTVIGATGGNPPTYYGSVKIVRVGNSGGSVTATNSGTNYLADDPTSVIGLLQPYDTTTNKLLFVQGYTGSRYFTYDGGFAKLSTSPSLGTSDQYPVMFGSQLVKMEYSGSNPGKSGGPYSRNYYSPNAINFSEFKTLSREIAVILPDTSNNGGVVGTVTRIVVYGSTRSNGPRFEIAFKSTTPTVKISGGPRFFVERNSYKTFTAIYTSSSEWLVFEE